ncbi:KRAB-A domain-containing protein 2-like [Vanessa atalanta]|uniref:KRAB-A domain-containing protein 2-like n=1 Tax=Vanessa atalanta TaxID=42275 RepID=UPI001FCDD735|nr:KRAB-A domain-containing protein 2-like [Vanessa atalanta]
MEESCDKNDVNVAVTDSGGLNFKENFNRKLVEYDEQHQGSHRKAWTSERISKVVSDIRNAQVTMSTGQRRTAMDYYWMSKYDTMTIGNEDCLIFKRITVTDPTVRILPREQYFDVLSDIHESCGHGGRDKILFEIKNKYYIPRKAVEIFVSLCPICKTKRNVPSKGIVAKPNVSNNINLGGQVDLIDFQSCPDGDFKWLLIYQENVTKFINLRPLKTKGAAEVAAELMKIFLLFGAPYNLQSDNDVEFTANVIKELVAMWPECKIVHENPRHSQTQGSVERTNQVVENMLRTWMSENNSTNWSVGCFFVQYLKNSSLNQNIGKSPYKALFGREPKADLNGSDIPTSRLLITERDEQLKTFIEREPVDTENNDYDNDSNSSKTSTENTEKIESNFTCAVCHNDATETHKCESCNTVHTMCGITGAEEGYDSKVVCIMCQVKPNIKVEGDAAHKGLKRAAENLIDATIKKIPRSDIGKSVLISVPKMDRGPLDIKYIHAKIVDIRNGVYKVATKYGTIKNWFSRQDLQYLDTNYGDEISESPISLRIAVASQSPLSRQGFQKCCCKPAVSQCRNNRCACFKNKVLCGSKCHGRLTCVNK